MAVVFGQDDDPFSSAVQGGEPPLREVSSMPSTIKYEQIDDNRHRYTLTGIYNASQRAEEEDRKDRDKVSATNRGVTDPFAPDGESGLSDDYPESIYKGTVPDCEDFTVDFETRKCTFLTSRELALSELADAIDQLAWIGGDIPYWSELETRDLEKSSLFSDEAYELVPYSGEVPLQLAWFSAPKWEPLATAFCFDLVEQGRLLIMPTTAHCMAHSRFSIRVLDARGKLIWQDLDTLVADVQVALVDIDRDGSHDLIIDQNDHGKSSRFLLRRNIEQCADDQLPARAETKAK